MKKTYLVVGSSASSNAVINTLVNLNAGEIICITKDETSYNTCFIADYLANKKNENDIALPIKKESNNNKVIGTVKKIDSLEKKVILNDNQEIYYDKLFLGIGSEPINYLAHEEVSGIFTFHNFNDAYNIKRYIDENKVKRAIIIGSGLTGLECAYALHQLEIETIIIEKENFILSNLIDQLDSNWLIERIGKKIQIFTNNFVSKYYKNCNKIGISLSNGIELYSDMVIIAQGAKPSLQMVQMANIECSYGIITNNSLQTNYEDIYAGGDCAMVKSLFDHKLIRNTTWPDAVIQGVIAAYNMAGVYKNYDGLLRKINSYFFGIRFFMCSDTNQNYIIKKTEDYYSKIAFNNDKVITGALLMGNYNQQQEILLRNAILKQKSIDNIDIKGYKYRGYK